MIAIRRIREEIRKIQDIQNTTHCDSNTAKKKNWNTRQ